jgi:hypothetical protein
MNRYTATITLEMTAYGVEDLNAQIATMLECMDPEETLCALECVEKYSIDSVTCLEDEP